MFHTFFTAARASALYGAKISGNINAVESAEESMTCARLKSCTWTRAAVPSQPSRQNNSGLSERRC
jgi:hypothetical protein